MQTVECHLKTARQAIIHVLAGRSADGSKAHSYVVPYPHRHTHHVAPSVILAQVLAGLERVLSDDELTALTLKLLTYIARSPSGVMATCWRLDTKALCRVMKQRPAIITSRAGLAAIFRSDEQEQAAQAKQKLRDDIKPRRVIATRQPYQLTEITDPQHLREDALRVGHCAATQFDKEFIASLGYQPKGREALLALTYWRRIVQGYMRIFSILQNGDPIVTIGYDIPRARIRDIATFEKRLTPKSVLLPTVCWAITELRNFLPIRSVFGLPDPPYANQGLTEDGQFVPILPRKNARVFHGAVLVTPQTTAEELRGYAYNRYIILDLSDAPPQVVSTLSYCRSSVRSFNDVTLEALCSIDGDIVVVGGASLVTPNLKSVVGSQFLNGARNVQQPQLEIVAHDNQCAGAGTVYQPRLRGVRYANVVSNVTALTQPPGLPRYPHAFDHPCIIPRYPTAHPLRRA